MIRGKLDRLHLGDLLQWLQMGGLSGRLSLSRRAHERRLDFIDGRVVFVSSQLPGEQLATWLANKGNLSVTEARRALAVSLLRRELFTDIVSRSGVVKATVLRKEVTRLAETIMARILVAGELEFTFDPGFPVRDLLGLNLDLEPNQLLLEAARLRDEGEEEVELAGELDLPFTGEAFESFFWDLVRTAISSEMAVSGEQLARLRTIVRDVLATLAHWLKSSPGLVPLPPNQATDVALALGEGASPPLSGHPHLVWNAMVVACSIRCRDQAPPQSLAQLNGVDAGSDIWTEMVCGEAWHRPHSKRLDDLTPRVAENWARLAGAAAPEIGLDRETVELAAHLLVVPTDLVLWVLSTVPVPQPELRRALLHSLPRRLGLALGTRADFPPSIRSLFAPQGPSPVGACLHLARSYLSSASVWPDPVPADEGCLLELASAGDLMRAASRIKEESGRTPDTPVAVG
ncbi:MAG: DUF4388 domain-containing protein [Acidobacteria bacterium]|nr:DUF4388 domain-containing protein [Acidobacteriota bacterium]